MKQKDLLKSFGCHNHTVKQICGGTTNPKKTKGYCYISGGMRGYENYNFDNFDRVRTSFVKKGYSVISPADIDRCDKLQCYNTQLPYVYRDFFSLFYIKTIADIMCKDVKIVMLENWETSIGACAELFLSRWLGIEAVNENNKVVKANWKKLEKSFKKYLEGK